MGRASSSKKVARAARAAGRPGAGRNLAWPATIGGVVIVGLLLIVFSRGNTEDSVAPKLGDHWHAGYAVYDCGTFLPPLNDVIADQSGLHTHGDGHVHFLPWGTSYTGKNANLGKWGETVGFEVSDTSFTSGSVERANGDSCGDLGEGVVQLKAWDGPDDQEGHLIEDDFADYAPQDATMWVLAFVPEGTEIPRPPQEVMDALRAPVDVVGSTVPPQTVPVDEPTTAPGTETTAPGTETTAPGTETTGPVEPTESTEPPGATTTAP